MVKVKLNTYKKEQVAGWLFALPWIIGFLVFTLGSMIYSLFISLTNYNLFNVPKFVGLANWKTMLFGDPQIWESLKVTTIYMLGAVPLQLIAGLFLAVLLNQKIRGLSLFRTVFYVPSMLPSVAVFLMWMLAYDPNYGFFNSILKLFGITGPKWLMDPHWALSALIIMSLWNAGTSMLIYLGGLQGIPTEMYEAAKVDGAGRVYSFFKITLPMLSPVVFYILLMLILSSLQSFNAAYIMTGGGPINSTYFFMLNLYQKAFQQYKMGYASSMAWLMFFYISTLTFLVFRFLGGRVYYENEIQK